jgi:hypothetical protein
MVFSWYLQIKADLLDTSSHYFTVSYFARPKGRAQSHARRTIQSLINISFLKIVDERGGGGGGGGEK